MTLPTDAELETAIAFIEEALVNEVAGAAIGAREVVGLWRKTLVYIEAIGASGYDALTQRDWTGDDLFNGPND